MEWFARHCTLFSYFNNCCDLLIALSWFFVFTSIFSFVMVDLDRAFAPVCAVGLFLHWRPVLSIQLSLYTSTTIVTTCTTKMVDWIWREKKAGRGEPRKCFIRSYVDRSWLFCVCVFCLAFLFIHPLNGLLYVSASHTGFQVELLASRTMCVCKLAPGDPWFYNRSQMDQRGILSFGLASGHFCFCFLSCEVTSSKWYHFIALFSCYLFDVAYFLCVYLCLSVCLCACSLKWLENSYNT